VIIIETISFYEAVKYPFKVPQRLLYVLLGFIPILGSFILFGYVVRLVNEFIEGRYEGLIKLDFMEDLKLGFIVFLKALPFYIVCVIIISAATYVSETLGIISLFFALFVIPILMVNFFRKQTIGSLFEFAILKVVKDNLGEYFMATLKQYALVIVFLILSFVLIGIPALYFTNSVFIANFYGDFIEQKHTMAFKTSSKDPLAV